MTDNPYDNPDNPPEDDNPDRVCCMKWSDEVHPISGNKKYWLRWVFCKEKGKRLKLLQEF